MERIFAGEVYDLVPQANGLVFSHRKETVGDNEWIVVNYKMISFDTGRMTDVAANIYQLSKFGSNYRAVVSLCDNYIRARALVLPSSRVLLTEMNGNATLFDSDGSPVWHGDVLYRGGAPADIAAYKNSIWASFPKANVLLRFNPATMREELRIGGINSPFNSPHDIFVDGDVAVVCSTGSNKLIQVDLRSYAVSDYMEFSEPVYSYAHIQKYEFVLLESGIYVL